jgi:hypothetical protein
MNLLFMFSIVLGLQGTIQAGWQHIRPMQSTCEDVSRIFGGNACQKKSVTYERPDELVTVVFSLHACDSRWPYEQYSAAQGTVIEVVVIPRYPKLISLSDLRLDKSQFQRQGAGDIIGAVEYVNNAIGTRFTATTDDRIMALEYFPNSKYDHLRCFPDNTSRPTKADIYGASSQEIASYDPNSTREQALSLNKAATSISIRTKRNSSMPLVYIIAYAGRSSPVEEAGRFAEEAKKLLVTKYKIDRDRIVTIDGGIKERAQIQVFVRPLGAAPPRINPTIYPGSLRQ